MNKYLPALLLGLLSLVLVGKIVIDSRSDIESLPQVQVDQDLTQGQAKITYFYGDTCPHCQEVLAWMEANGINDKVEVSKKEVYNNPINSSLLTQAAQKCGLVTDSVGVPFLVTRSGACLVGSDQVLEYLNLEFEQAELKADESAATKSAQER